MFGQLLDPDMVPDMVDEAMLTPKCGFGDLHTGTSWLNFRTRGFMDEAMTEGVQKIQPLLQQFTMPSIIRVELFSPEEAGNSTDDSDIRIYYNVMAATILSMIAPADS
jgi:hypothetical protein